MMARYIVFDLLRIHVTLSEAKGLPEGQIHPNCNNIVMAVTFGEILRGPRGRSE